MSLLLGLFTFILVLVSLFLVLVILAQRAKSDGGVAAGLGGGMAEAAFGAESGNVLSRSTTIAAVVFFVLSFGLYLGHVHQNRRTQIDEQNLLPAVSLPASETPAAPEGAPAPAPENAATPPAEGPAAQEPAQPAPAEQTPPPASP